MSADEVARSLTQKLAAVPGMRVFISNPPVINIGGRSSKSQYQFTLQSSDIEALYDGAAALEQRLHEVPGLTDVTSDLQIKNPQVQVEHRPRPRGGARHRRQSDRERALQRLRRAAGQHDLHAERPVLGGDGAAARSTSATCRRMNLLHLTGREGVSVPLGQPGQGDRRRPGPLTVNHSGQLPSVTLSFNLAAGHLDRHRGRAGGGGRARGAAVHRQHQLRGHRAGVPGRRSRACWCCWSSRSW